MKLTYFRKDRGDPMSEDSRLSLVRRVANALLGLEALSDAKIAKLDPNRVHGGEGAGVSMLRDKSPYEFHSGELASLCDRMEQRIDQERRFVAPPATKTQEDYWFFEEWEGKDYRTVAHRTGMEADDVWRKRERAGVNPQNGRPLEAAA